MARIQDERRSSPTYPARTAPVRITSTTRSTARRRDTDGTDGAASPRLLLLEELFVEVRRLVRHPRLRVDFVTLGPTCVLELRDTLLVRHVARLVEDALRAGAESVLVVASREAGELGLTVLDDGREHGDPGELSPRRPDPLRPAGPVERRTTRFGKRRTRLTIPPSLVAGPEVAFP